MKKIRRFSTTFASIFGLALAGSTASTLAQSSVTLDGTSGNKTVSTNYSTTGGLTLGLGFFADYLVVGGGGSGGTPGGSGGQDTWGTGGGGGGGLLTGNTQLSSSNYSVTVGAGGSAPSYNASSTTRGNNGGNSTFGAFTAIGGGGGGGGESSFSGVGAAGGSGGGGGSKYSNAGGAGTASQGNAGGNARNGDTSSAGGRTAGGGGGGAGQAGFTPASNSSTGGKGGNGTASSITGSSVTYAGGGGGGARDTHGGQAAGAGGTGGGGAGATTSSAGSGTDGLGGGGGGRGADGVGGDGGDGIVIVRYQGASLGNIGGTVTSGTGTAAGYTLHTFSSTGNSSLDLSGVNMSSRLGTTLTGTLSGTGGMTYNGPGTLVLSASNTFTGETRIANGTLAQGSSLALRYSTLNMTSSDSGVLSFQPSTPGNYTYLLGGLTGSRGIAMGGNSLSIGGNNGTTTYSGSISGSGGLTKIGTGTLTLSGNNTYSDKTYVGSGTLATSGDNRLGTSKIVDIWNSATLRLGGNETFEQVNYYGNIIVDSNAYLTYHPTYPANTASGFYNSISGAGGFIKDGASMVSLVMYAAGANKTYTYTGDTIVNAGSLWTQKENQLPTGNTVIVNSGAAFGLIGNQTLGAVIGSGTVYMYRNNLTVGATSGTFSGSLVGAGNLIKNGAGTLTLSGNNSGSFTGDADITGGTLVLNSSNALSTDAVITMSAGTTLTVNQRTFVGALDQGGGTVNGPGELVATLTSTSSGSLNAVIGDGIDFSAGILKRTGGTTTVGAANTFTGAVKVQDGTLQLTGSGSFSSASSLVTSTGGTMDLNNKSQTFSKISGTGGAVALGSGTLTVNQASDTDYGGAITGSGGFVKSGAGNLTLSGNSTYLGATTVSAGQLTVDGSLASATTVQSGATLTGSGSVGGLIINSGATVNPGNSPGTLTVNGNAVWNAGGNYDWESMATNTDQNVQTAAGTDWDYMDISGTLTLGGLGIGNEFHLNLTSLSDSITNGEISGWDPAVGSTWLIASAAGGIYLDASLIGMNTNYTSLFDINTAGWSGSIPLGGFQVITLGSTTDLYLQALGSAAVPEPGQVAASILLLAGIGGYVWMKRRKEAKAKAAVV